MGIVYKISAPQLIAAKKTQTFIILSHMVVVCGVLLVPLIVGTVVPFRGGLAYDYGENACEYAKDDACLPFFTKVFGPNSIGGDFTLPFTFDAFAIGASIDAVFIVLRACLLALVDLDFMLWSTIAAIVVYIPVICVAALVKPFGGQAISFFIAMYIPQFVLVCLFFVRFEIMVRRIVKEQKENNEKQAAWVNKSLSIRNIKLEL